MFTSACKWALSGELGEITGSRDNSEGQDLSGLLSVCKSSHGNRTCSHDNLQNDAILKVLGC